MQADVQSMTTPDGDTDATVRPRTWPVVRLLVRPLIRTVAVLVVVSGIAIGLGSVYPIEHELDVAGYRYSTFMSQAAIEIQHGEEDAVREELNGADVAIGSFLSTDVIVGNSYFGPADIFIISKSTSQDVTLMPSATLLSRVDVTGDDWIDLSGDAADALGLTAGDTVNIQVTPDAQATLTIRGVYAVRELGVAAYGQVPATAVDDLLAASAYAPTIVFTTASTQVTDQMLNSSARAAQLDAGGYVRPFQSESRTDMLERATRQSSANLGLIIAVALASLLALVLFVVRECVVFIRKADDIGALLDDLGVPRKTTLTLASALVIPAALGALLSGALISKTALSSGFIVPGFPPTLESTWWTAAALTGIASVTIAVIYVAISARRRRG